MPWSSPNPVVALKLAFDTMAAATEAESLDEMFLRLEAAGVMLRIDAGRVPTMAKAPTLGVWELELLRTVERVVRLGHVRYVAEREMVLDGGVLELDPGSLVIHCAAVGPALPTDGSPLATGQDPTADDSSGIPLLRRRARRLRGSNP